MSNLLSAENLNAACSHIAAAGQCLPALITRVRTVL